MGRKRRHAGSIVPVGPRDSRPAALARPPSVTPSTPPAPSCLLGEPFSQEFHLLARGAEHLQHRLHAVGLLHGQTGPPSRPGLVQVPVAPHLHAPITIRPALEGVEPAGHGPDIRGQATPPPPLMEDAGSAPREQRQPHRRTAEIAPVERTTLLVPGRLVVGQVLLFDEAPGSEPRVRGDALHVRAREGGQPLALLHLATRGTQQPRATGTDRTRGRLPTHEGAGASPPRVLSSRSRPSRSPPPPPLFPPGVDPRPRPPPLHLLHELHRHPAHLAARLALGPRVVQRQVCR